MVQSTYLVVVITRPLPIGEDYAALEARSGPGVVEGKAIVKDPAAQRVCSWNEQNEVRSVRDRITSGAVQSTVNSSDSTEKKSLTEGCVRW